MLYWLIIGIHVFVSLVLIAVILLQAGRGGGLSETFGASTQTILGTRASVVLKRATEVCAIIYILTCLTLAVMTSHRGRSLVTGSGAVPVSTPGVPATPQPLPDDFEF
ncbi:MAG: preprotein translocase subunit SecG [Candidatus Omnitrophica bacterium]|nr:preprotein translocase subunit SecG [Candidatus Omnitrophota bacterium]MCM8790908.1 preprotein translocase subunit SecG [Candidatus Omnitrophota bacterium]